MNGVYLGDNRVLSETAFGYQIFVDTRDVSITPHILFSGAWEAWITNQMGPLLKGCLFLDIGANVGWYTLFAAYSEAASVIAVEPNPVLCNLLRQSMAANGIPGRVYQNAIGVVHEEVSLVVDDQRAADAFIGSKDDNEYAGWGGHLKVKSHLVTVNTVLLDEIVQNAPKETLNCPVIIKIDTEGSEPQAIQGGMKTVRERNCTLFIEHNGGQEEMVSTLMELGYRPFLVDIDETFKPLEAKAIAALPHGAMVCYRRFPS